MKGTRRQSEGFTFVELLVVVAIIGILAALLLPAISTGRSGRCQFNLRQIQMSYAIAVDDNDNRYGGRTSLYALIYEDVREQGGTTSSLDDFWLHNWGLRQYGWLCPSTHVRPTVPSQAETFYFDLGGLNYATSIRLGNGNGESVERDYSYIQNLAFDEGASSAFIKENNADRNRFAPFIAEGDVQHPAQTPIWGDGIHDSFRFSNQLPPWTMTQDRAPFDFDIPRHRWKPNGIPDNADFPANQKLPGATNLSFADGHVEQVPLERLWSLYWHATYVPPAKRPGL